MSTETCKPTWVLIPSEKDTALKQSASAYVKEKYIGDGTVYIAKESIVWVKEGETEAFEIYYTDLYTHYPDTTEECSPFPQACVHLSVNAKKNQIGQVKFAELEKDKTVVYDNVYTESTTVRLVPSSTEIVYTIDKTIENCETNKCIIQ